VGRAVLLGTSSSRLLAGAIEVLATAFYCTPCACYDLYIPDHGRRAGYTGQHTNLYWAALNVTSESSRAKSSEKRTPCLNIHEGLFAMARASANPHHGERPNQGWPRASPLSQASERNAGHVCLRNQGVLQAPNQATNMLNQLGHGVQELHTRRCMRQSRSCCQCNVVVETKSLRQRP
jgi:hypothetical protein